MDNHDCCSSHHTAAPSVHQNLNEMEFERGLWGAAFDGNVDRLEHLLKKNSDPSVIDSSGYTALHYAARNGKETACKILLGRGANVNAQTPGGATSLHRAAYMGHINIVSILLKHNGNPSLLDSDGRNALHKAAERKHLSVATILVTFDPELKKQKDSKGLTPLDYVNIEDSDFVNLLN